MVFSCIRTALFILVMAALVTAPQALQAQRGAFTPTATFKPALTLSETRSDAVVTTRDPLDSTVTFSEAVTTQSTSLTFTADMTGTDPASFDEGTGFEFQAGNIDYFGTLGDDPNYAPGDTSISIPLHGFDPETNKPLSAAALKLAWTAKVLTVTVTANSKSNNPDLSLIMSVYSPIGLGPIPKVRATSIIRMTLSDTLAGETRAFIQGVETYTQKTVDGQTFDLSGFTVTGTFDIAAPVITVKSPAKGARFINTASPLITGTCTDAHDVYFMEVCDNPFAPLPDWMPGGLLDPVELPEGQEWQATSLNWSHQVGLLPNGSHTIGIRCADITGNYSPTTLVTFTVIPDFNVLLPTPAFKPTLKATASLTDRGVQTGGTVETFSDGKGSLTFTGSMDGADLSSLNAATPLALSVGPGSWTGVLGDDPAYKPGKTSATFVMEPEPGNRTTIKFSWTAKSFTVTATFAGSAEVSSANFGLFDWVREPTIVMDFDMRSRVDVGVNLGQQAGTAILYATLKTTVTAKKVGGVDLLLNTVTASAVNDTVSPVVTLTSPAAGGSTQTGTQVVISGKLSEGFNLARIEWATDLDYGGTPRTPIDFVKTSTKPVFDASDFWGPVSGTWEATVPFDAVGGGGQVWIRAVDEAGNASTPISVNYNKPFTLPSLAGLWQGVLQRSDADLAGSYALGRISMTSTAKGAVSGKIGIFPLMSADVPFTGIIYQPDAGAAEFHAKVTLVQGAEPVWLFGTLAAASDASDHVFSLEISDIQGTGSVYAVGYLFLTPYSTSNPVPEAYRGLFNGAITSAPATPAPNAGHLGVTIAKTGVVTVAGRLADGTALTWTGALSGVPELLPPGPAIPFAAPLYKNKGGIAGVLRIELGDAAPLVGNPLHWVRPSDPADPTFPTGVDAYATVTGGRYVPLNLKAHTSLHLVADSEDAACDLDLVLAINATTGAIQLPAPNASQLKLTLDAKSGLLTGGYRTADGKSAAFSSLLAPDGFGPASWQGHVIADPAPAATAKRLGTFSVTPSP